MSTLSLQRAAEVLCVHPKTVADLIHDGALPAARIGRAYVLLEKDVLGFIEQQIVRQTADRMRGRKCKAAGSR